MQQDKPRKTVKFETQLRKNKQNNVPNYNNRDSREDFDDIDIREGQRREQEDQEGQNLEGQDLDGQELEGQEGQDIDDQEDEIDQEDQEDQEDDEQDDDELEGDDYGDDEQIVGLEDDEIEIGEDDGCLYRFGKANVTGSDDEDVDVDDVDDIAFDDDTKKDSFIVKDDERETKPVMTKYERVRILGDRAKQLSLGAKPMLLGVENMNPKEIARLELERKVVPFIVEKVMPDGRRERWKVSELKIVN
jgi:DNA-directed RNA polymerase subunit K/omega